MINILIVEDEFTIALDIEQRLKKMGFNPIGIASDYNEASSLLLENSEIDLALLDINLGEGKSGIDLGKLILNKFDIPVVFLTAYSDDATFESAEEDKPMGYIIKPFKDADIKHAIHIALQRFNKKVEPQNTGVKNTEILFVKDKGNITKVLIEDIVWIEAMDNYTIIHLKNGKRIVNLFLKDVLAMLDNRKFVRIHKSHAVAINKISSIEGNNLFVHGVQLQISRKYKKELLNIINII